MTLKQKLIKEYKDAVYLETISELRIKAVPDGEENDYLRNRYAIDVVGQLKVIDALRSLFTENDKKYLLPKLDEECKMSQKRISLFTI
jgi:hypothetical protein